MYFSQWAHSLASIALDSLTGASLAIVPNRMINPRDTWWSGRLHRCEKAQAGRAMRNASPEMREERDAPSAFVIAP